MKVIKKKITIWLVWLFLVLPLFLPTPVIAANVFRQIGRAIKRTSRFVVNLPNKTTRWMGPVLGPLAADILTQNLSRSARLGNLFRNARRIDKNIKDLEAQKQAVNQIKQGLRDQANELRAQAEAIRQSRHEFASGLTSGEITYAQYRDKVLSLEAIAQSYEQTADKFNRAADRMRPENLIKTLTRNAWQQTLGQIKDSVLYEVKAEVTKHLNPQVINYLVRGGNLDLNDIINLLIAQEIDGSNQGENDQELRDRVNQRVQELLKNNRDALKNNWQEKLQEIIKNTVKELEKERENLPTQETGTGLQTEPDNETSQSDSDSRCPAGYEFCPQCGVDCRQKNCNDIASAHWSYTGDCVCGSAGSMNENPKDPNKACRYGANNQSCPNCVYQCVHTNEDCPKAP